MKYRYPIGSYVQLRTPDDEGRMSDGTPMTCRVLEHVASDLRQPMYVVNEGNIHGQRYEMLVSEDDLVLIADEHGQRRR